MNEQIKTNNRESVFSYDSLILIAANGLSLVFFLTGKGAIVQVLWTYWLQSVIIGIVNVRRILSFQGEINLSTTSGSTFNIGGIIKSLLAMFFVFHYGVFHLVYGGFLVAFAAAGDWTINGVQHQEVFTAAERSVSIIAVLTAGVVFAVHHFIAYAQECQVQSSAKKNIYDLSKVMFKPYARIIPMHLIILIAPFVALEFGGAGVFVIFMLMKTFVDLIFHVRGVGHMFAPKIFPPQQTVEKTS